MSNEALNWAWKQTGINSSTKFVLVAMSDSVRESNQFYKAIKTLCDYTNLDRKTVIRALKTLSVMGLIEDTGRRKGNTRQVVVYKLNFLNGSKNGTVPETEQFQISDETVPNFPLNSTKFPLKESQIWDTEPYINHKEPLLNPKQTFETFWEAYPRKVKMDNAQKVWLKINPDEQLLAKILAALTRQKKTQGWLKDGGKYIPHPTTWLNGKRWEDELEPEANKSKKEEPFMGIAGLI